MQIKNMCSRTRYDYILKRLIYIVRRRYGSFLVKLCDLPFTSKEMILSDEHTYMWSIMKDICKYII